MEINVDSNKLQAGMNSASQTVSSFTDRISKSAATLQGFGQVGMHAMGIMDRFEISSMNVSNALMSVQDAQMRYNSALSEFGAGSEQAIMAQNSLERATNQYEAAQMRANMSLATMGITMFGMIPQILKFGSTAISTLKGVEIAALMTSVRLKALAPELLILSAIAGGIYYLWSTQTQKAEIDTKNFGETAYTSFSTAGMSADQLRDKIKNLDDQINKTKESAKQAQTPLDQYLSFHADTAGVRKATSEEFFGDRTKLPSDHPLYQPSGKTLDLMGQKETAEMDLYRSLGGKIGDRGGAQYFVNPPTQPLIQPTAQAQFPVGKLVSTAYGEGNAISNLAMIYKLDENTKALNDTSRAINNWKPVFESNKPTPNETASNLGEFATTGYDYTKLRGR